MNYKTLIFAGLLGLTNAACQEQTTQKEPSRSVHILDRDLAYVITDCNGDRIVDLIREDVQISGQIPFWAYKRKGADITNCSYSRSKQEVGIMDDELLEKANKLLHSSEETSTFLRKMYQK
jgi:hypothetical protein